MLDLSDVPKREKEEEPNKAISLEARLVEAMREGMTLRDAQNELILQGEKKNAVKQAALALKKLFE